jgi:Uma2 family endonuclease
MASNPRKIVAPHVYLERERAATYKSEYINGEMYAMAGASEAHNLITINAVTALHGQLRKCGCRIYANDMRVKIPATLLYTYPDIVMVCGQRQFDDAHKDTLTNPLVLMEVLSPSTEAYDRGEKFAHYRRAEGLQEYILMAQDKMRVEQYVRQPDESWNLRIIEEATSELVLDSVEARVLLSDLYDGVFDDE